MANLAGHKTFGAPFSNEKEFVKVVYDFDVDGGAVSDIGVLTIDGDLVLTNFYANVITAVTSDGAPAIDLGIGAGGTEIWSDKAKGGLLINTIVGMDTVGNVRVADASVITLGIETAALTAGKIEFVFEFAKL